MSGKKYIIDSMLNIGSHIIVEICACGPKLADLEKGMFIIMKLIRRILYVLHLIVGIGALAGGLLTILNPKEPLGMSVDALKYSPFSDYLIPGILLFIVIGFGNVFSAYMFLKKSKYQGYISGTTSCGLLVWLIVQCIMLRAVVFLHILFFIIGIVQGLLSVALLFEQKLFPTNILIKIFNKKAAKEAN